MKAVQFFGKEDLQLVEVPKPLPKDNEVLLKIEKVGICGTDLHIYHGGMSVPIPLIMGHEFVGEVVEVGNQVSNVNVGDQAVAEHVIGCNVCQYCRQGKRNLCIKPQVFGLHRPGALAEYLAVPSDLVYVLPKEISVDDGVLVEPLSIAVYAVLKANIGVGNQVAVVGQGPIGLLVDQVTKTAGAKVIGIDVMDSRLRFAVGHQYVHGTINPKNQELLPTFQKLTRLEGADIVFEVVGQESTAQSALELAKPSGKVLVLGVFEHNISLNMMNIVRKELTVQGSWTCLDTFKPAIELLATGQVKLDDFITHRYTLAQAKKAFDQASTYSESRIKSIIEF